MFLTQEVGDELIVVDTEERKGYCLNNLAKLAWGQEKLTTRRRLLKLLRAGLIPGGIVTMAALPSPAAAASCISVKNQGPCIGAGSTPCCSNLTCNTSSNKCQ